MVDAALIGWPLALPVASIFAALRAWHASGDARLGRPCESSRPRVCPTAGPSSSQTQQTIPTPRAPAKFPACETPGWMGSRASSGLPPRWPAEPLPAAIHHSLPGRPLLQSSDQTASRFPRPMLCLRDTGSHGSGSRDVSSWEVERLAAAADFRKWRLFRKNRSLRLARSDRKSRDAKTNRWSFEQRRFATRRQQKKGIEPPNWLDAYEPGNTRLRAAYTRSPKEIALLVLFPHGAG
jgi:hypothetical protein